MCELPDILEQMERSLESRLETDGARIKCMAGCGKWLEPDEGVMLNESPYSSVVCEGCAPPEYHEWVRQMAPPP